MTDIVEKLRGYARDDHERGCQGREYDCSCGYDGKRDPLLEEAAAEIERLRAKCERLVAENNRLVRLCDPFLSSADLKAVDKHCDWVAFGHAYRAMRNSRAALGGENG